MVVGAELAAPAPSSWAWAINLAGQDEEQGVDGGAGKQQPRKNRPHAQCPGRQPSQRRSPGNHASSSSSSWTSVSFAHQDRAPQQSHNALFLLAGGPGAYDVTAMFVTLEARALAAVALRAGADADLVEPTGLGAGRDEPTAAALVGLEDLVAVNLEQAEPTKDVGWLRFGDGAGEDGRDVLKVLASRGGWWRWVRVRDRRARLCGGHLVTPCAPGLGVR